jgi:cyclophilin family peptidyl-prolyl cis-trans isomerase
VTPDFIIQTGDPNGVNGEPPDGPGYTIADELPKKGRSYVFGAVGFANAGEADSAGSQFFVIVHDLPGAIEGDPTPLRIDRTYTIFGRVPQDYYGSIQEIAEQPTLGGSDPLQAVRPRLPVFLESVEIVERG